MKVCIIGAGAAGCFCAIEMKRRHPDWDVIVLEKGSRPLAKVSITGGGRCNLTNSFARVRSIKEVYPRGEKLMKRALKVFSHIDTMSWFEREGVPLLTQADECVFPVSQDAMEIVNTLLHLMRQLGVKLLCNQKVVDIHPSYIITTETEQFQADRVVVTIGGMPKTSYYSMLSSLLPDVVNKVEAFLPSLFTFTVNDAALHSLMGTVVEPVATKVTGTKYQADGPLLITHWGLSGPAILKLSSHGARYLAEHDYNAEVSVNWFCDEREPDVLVHLQSLAASNAHKQLQNAYPQQFVQRHWVYLITKIGLSPQKRWQEVGSKQMNRLASLLTNDTYRITGKGQFKDEFVTCGGIPLSDIDLSTLESKYFPGLYFAGEVLDVDAITGGFNLQAAWTTGYIVAQQ